jgi:hypothetical protein
VSNKAEGLSAGDFPQRDAPFAPRHAPRCKLHYLLEPRQRAGQQGAEMSTSNQATPAAADQREALKSSEKKASEKQPGSFKEKATDEKIVEIPPAGPEAKPIRGLDSK